MSTASGVDFAVLCRLQRLPAPTREYHFALDAGRGWRFDWCWPQQRVALEVDGGVDKIGRHQRAAGFRKDREKLNAAACDGWLVVHCEPAELATAPTFDMLRRVLALR